MKANMSVMNRVVRVIIGLVIIGIGYYYKSWWGALGLIPLISASIGYCPLCCKGGTCSTPKEEKHEHKHGDGCCH